MEEGKDYTLHVRKVKMIAGDAAAVEKEAAEFQKAHDVEKIIQRSERLMIVFYWGKVEDEGEGSK